MKKRLIAFLIGSVVLSSGLVATQQLSSQTGPFRSCEYSYMRNGIQYFSYIETDVPESPESCNSTHIQFDSETGLPEFTIKFGVE